MRYLPLAVASAPAFLAGMLAGLLAGAPTLAGGGGGGGDYAAGFALHDVAQTAWTPRARGHGCPAGIRNGAETCIAN